MKAILDWARGREHWSQLTKVLPITWVLTMMRKTKTWRWRFKWQLTLRRIDTCFRNKCGHMLLTFTPLPTPCFTKLSLKTICSWLRLDRKEAGWYSWCPHVWIVNGEGVQSRVTWGKLKWITCLRSFSSFLIFKLVSTVL